MGYLQWIYSYKPGNFGPLNSVKPLTVEALPLLPEEMSFTLPGEAVMVCRGLLIIVRNYLSSSPLFASKSINILKFHQASWVEKQSMT